MQMKAVPYSCVRGHVAFKEASSGKFTVSVFAAPSNSATPSDQQALWQWNRPVAKTETNSDGQFCLDHLPADRTYTLSFFQKDSGVSFWSPIQPLSAEPPDDKTTSGAPMMRPCGATGLSAKIEIKTPSSQGFRCVTDYEKCANLGELKGELRATCDD